MLPRSRSRVQQAIDDYRRALLANEAGRMSDMAARWLQVERSLEASIQALTQEAAALRASGQGLSRSDLYRLERYQALLAQAYAESRKFVAFMDEALADARQNAAKMGVESSQALIRESYLEAGRVVARFDLLPVEAIEAIAGATMPGSPLYDVLMNAYSSGVQTATENLLRAVAKGTNPRQTAQEMANDLAAPLNKALLIARTEQNRAFRTAATEQMKASGVVDGWIWRCALQERTCLSCLAMDGSEHDLDEDLNDHPSGRCFKQPKIKGLEPLQVQTGAAWFDTLDQDTQARMMGPQRFEAWSSGQFSFKDMAKTETTDDWGTEVRLATLEELIP